MSRINELKVLYPSLGLVFLSTLVLMFIYEMTKQVIIPDISIWASHGVTILFTSLISIFIVYFPLRSFYLEQQKTRKALSIQQETEERLRKSELQYRSFVESIEDSIYTVDLECRYLLINARHLARRDLSPLAYTGKKYGDFHSPAETRVFEEQVKKVLEFKSPVQDEYEQNRRYFLRKLNPVIDPLVNEVIAISAISSDITERKLSEKSLCEANHKLRLLTGLTRHDILNSLTAIQLLHDLALETSDLTSSRDYISRARQAGERMKAIIKFTQEYENFGTVFCGWQRMHKMTDSARTEVSLGNVIMENRIPEDLEVYADPIIKKVFTTLLENAVRHGENITKIRFRCKEIENDLIIICEDDGVGIPAEEKKYIFDHGFGRHTGVGLFLAREILSITELSILECGIPGKGARFEIFVPAGKFRRSDEITSCGFESG